MYLLFSLQLLQILLTGVAIRLFVKLRRKGILGDQHFQQQKVFQNLSTHGQKIMVTLYKKTIESVFQRMVNFSFPMCRLTMLELTNQAFQMLRLAALTIVIQLAWVWGVSGVSHTGLLYQMLSEKILMIQNFQKNLIFVFFIYSI